MSELAWFQGDEPRSDDETRFLSRLRELAAGWAVPGLTPESSGCMTVLIPLLVSVSHPALAGGMGLTELQVGYWPPTSDGPRLEGEWGDGHLLDNDGQAEDLRVQGVSGEPEFFAEAAAAWVEAQLLRPIERAEWLKRNRVVATRVRLVGGGQTLARRGSWARTRRAPDRTIPLN